MQHCLVKHTAHPRMGKRRSWASKVWHNVDCSGTPGENSYSGAITEENLSARAGRNTNVRDMYLPPPWKNVRNMTPLIIPLNLLYDARWWNGFFPGGTLRWICVHMLKWTQEKGSESQKVGLHPSTTCRRDLPHQTRSLIHLVLPRQISSFASICSATFDDFLQLFLINAPHTHSLSSDKRCTL